MEPLYQKPQLAYHGSKDNTLAWLSASRRRVKSDAGPIQELPPNRWIISEAERLALEAFTEALRRKRLVPKRRGDSKDTNDSKSPEVDDRPAAQSPTSISRNLFMSRKPEAHQVFRAIEDQDLGILAEIAEHDFAMLLRPLSSGTNQTPLNHALDCGPGHRGVALLLLGMFSRYVNHLSDMDFQQPQARETLRLLRVNFALAMNRGVMQADNTLAASFLQVYIMSKGQQWLADMVSQISIALRSTTPGEPVALAGHGFRQYAGKMLKQDEIIAALEDYIGNATADLLMMAAWDGVRQAAPDDTLTAIPPHYFARDERVFNAFVEKLDTHRQLVFESKFIGRRLRSQLTVLRECLDGRATTYRSKIMMVDRELNKLCGM
ncbi:hypothetical protein B0H16DRAFT_1600516 [Mycena metata]|uniref:Uncharacterized protein n=1 Tax=Mycena metata TaxID=1033252 RepID=A0AAD7HJV0_9AGAR|nr:hypothetical protein B0H16DRAFT_1600516 [Mycena metata]